MVLPSWRARSLRWSRHGPGVGQGADRREVRRWPLGVPPRGACEDGGAERLARQLHFLPRRRHPPRGQHRQGRELDNPGAELCQGRVLDDHLVPPGAAARRILDAARHAGQGVALRGCRHRHRQAGEGRRARRGAVPARAQGAARHEAPPCQRPGPVDRHGAAQERAGSGVRGEDIAEDEREGDPEEGAEVVRKQQQEREGDGPPGAERDQRRPQQRGVRVRPALREGHLRLHVHGRAQDQELETPVPVLPVRHAHDQQPERADRSADPRGVAPQARAHRRRLRGRGRRRR
mmetsp:Transcript_1760/g.5195  ORF Transcript_1760/g.5195 Transcript_1760/m.5195 type:complete len:291 (+) Transcript_1760:690-1562(+)